jgi:long-chain acyl-CoA synthetase
VSPSKHTPWLAHYPKHVDWQAGIRPRTLPEIVEQSVRRWPKRVALRFFGRALTYESLWQEITSTATALQNQGVKPGMRVALLMPNCPAYVVYYYAILHVGAVVVNINPLLAREEMESLLQDAGASLVVYANLALCTDKLMECRKHPRLVDIGLLPVDFAREIGGVRGWMFRWLKAKELAKNAPTAPVRTQDSLLTDEGDNMPYDRLALLQYTGGTTGLPKAAMLTHANLAANVEQCRRWCRPPLVDGQERMLGVLPLFHVFAMTTVMNLGLAMGMEIRLLPRFDLKQVMAVCRRFRPTVIPGVPSMFAAMAGHRAAHRLGKLGIKCCISGGAALPEAVQKRFESVTGAVLFEGYGLTEASPVCCVNPLENAARSGTIGVPLPQTYAVIRRPTPPYDRLPFGEIGELCIAGPQVMRGYWQKEAETNACFHDEKDGLRWLRTGDLAYMAEDGYVTIVDRLKEMIIRNGYNIYPRHIEEVLLRHPAVLECAVVGEPNHEAGECVVVHLALRPGTQTTDEALMEFLQDKIARYALPSAFVRHASLPKSMIGKILKKQLKGSP